VIGYLVVLISFTKLTLATMGVSQLAENTIQAFFLSWAMFKINIFDS